MRGMSPSPILRVGLGNCGGHGRTKKYKARLIEQLNVASFGLNEGDGATRHFRDPRFQVHAAARGGENRMPRGYLDTAILRKRRWPLLRFRSERISDRVWSSIRNAPDRHATVVCYRHPIGDVAHVNVHLNAAPGPLRGWNPQHPVVREYARSVAALDRILTELRSDPDHDWLIIVTGDMNLPVSVRRPWSVGPVLAKHGLFLRTVHLDYLAFDRRLALTRPLRVLPRRVTGADHPWLVARFRLRRGASVRPRP